MEKLQPKHVKFLRVAVRIYKLKIKIREKRQSAHKIISNLIKRDLKKKIKERLFFLKNCALQ